MIEAVWFHPLSLKFLYVWTWSGNECTGCWKSTDRILQKWKASWIFIMMWIARSEANVKGIQTSVIVQTVQLIKNVLKAHHLTFPMMSCVMMAWMLVTVRPKQTKWHLIRIRKHNIYKVVNTTQVHICYWEAEADKMTSNETQNIQFRNMILKQIWNNNKAHITLYSENARNGKWRVLSAQWNWTIKTGAVRRGCWWSL